MWSETINCLWHHHQMAKYVDAKYFIITKANYLFKSSQFHRKNTEIASRVLFWQAFCVLFGRIEVRPDFVLRVLHAKQMDRLSFTRYVCVSARIVFLYFACQWKRDLFGGTCCIRRCCSSSRSLIYFRFHKLPLFSIWIGRAYNDHLIIFAQLFVCVCCAPIFLLLCHENRSKREKERTTAVRSSTLAKTWL